jgi:hypothetical protein
MASRVPSICICRNIFQRLERERSTFSSANGIPKIVALHQIIYRGTWIPLVPWPIRLLAFGLRKNMDENGNTQRRKSILTEQYMVILQPLHAFNGFFISPFFHGFRQRGFMQYALSPAIPLSTTIESSIAARRASSEPAMQSRTEW